jgi:hypothetical protein
MKTRYQLILVKEKIKNVLVYKDYSLMFRKTTLAKTKDMNHNDNKYTNIDNKYIIQVLQNIQKKYHFDIVSLKLETFGVYSEIIIRCAKEDKNKIFIEFCNTLGDNIEAIRY